MLEDAAGGVLRTNSDVRGAQENIHMKYFDEKFYLKMTLPLLHLYNFFITTPARDTLDGRSSQ